MFTRRRNNSHAVRFSNCGRLLTAVSRLCLTLALWHAPFPVLHAHSFEVDRVARDTWLAHHVEDFHGAPHDDDHSGWHVHLMLMQDVCPCGERHGTPVRGSHGEPSFKMAVPTTGASLVSGLEMPALDVIPLGLSAPALNRLCGVGFGMEGLSGGGSFSQVCAVQGGLSLHELLAHRVC